MAYLLPLLAAGFLTFVPPVTPAKRVLGAAFWVYGTAGLAYYVMVAAGPWVGPELPNSFASALAFSLFLALLCAFLLVYPTPARGRAAVPAALATLLLGATSLLWLLDPGLLYAGPMEPENRTLLWRIGQGDGWVVVALLAVAASLWRVREVPGPQRRGALLLLAAIAIYFGAASPGGLLVRGLLFATGTLGGVYQNALQLAVPGDCCGVSAVLWVAARALAAPALLAAFVRRERYWLPLAVAAVDAAIALVGATTGLFLRSTAELAFLALFVALLGRGALDLGGTPAWARRGFAAVFGLYVFLVVASLVVGNAPGFALAVPLGVVLGLVAGGVGAQAVLPPGQGLLAWAGAEPPGATERRLDPYAIALDRELAGGASPEEAFERLRPLRASLRVSDREHAVLAYARKRGGPAAAGDPGEMAPGARFLDRYRVVSVLRQGGMGLTRLCRDERMDRNVVLKSLRSRDASSEGVDAVLREARAMGRVRHPAVVTVHDVERVGDEAFIIMEHVEGGSLEDHLAKGPLDPVRFRIVAGGLLDALGAVHGAGLVHRDVKPSNVLLTGTGEVKLADFGVAHIPGYETTAAALDASAVGTIRYMSPEQARGRGVTAQSDLFSAGATLFEAWTGEPYLQPKPGESAIELQLRAATADGFRRAVKGPKALKAWFARALEPVPARRFATAGDMRAALEQALGPR